MNKVNKIYPSLLAINYLKIENELQKMEKAKIKYIHYDVMDGHFVPNISFGSDILHQIGKYNQYFKFDVHLMITNPSQYLYQYENENVNSISIHIECKEDKLQLISKIKQMDKKVGLVVNPKTKIEEITDYLNLVDFILLMSVEPGFGGQQFNENTYTKIEHLANLREKLNLNFLIQIDGGINSENAKKCQEKGANIFVAGTSFFKEENYEKIDEKFLGE